MSKQLLDMLAVLAVSLAVVMAGCAGVSSSPPESSLTPVASPASPDTDSPPTTTSKSGGYLEALVVDHQPENATVLSVNDSSIDDIEPVQEAIREAYTNGQVENYFSERVLERLEDEMPRSAIHNGDWYVSYRDVIIRIRIVHYV